MKVLLIVSALLAFVRAQNIVTYCYRDQPKLTLDIGQVGLFDQVTIDNQKHQMNPYDMEPFDVYVSLTSTDNGQKCGTIADTGNNQVHQVNCDGGVQGRYLHFVAKGEYIVMCSLSVKGRPLPVTTPTPAATAPAKLNTNCEEVGQADIIFIIDASGSVKQQGFNDEKRFVTSIIASLNYVRPDGNGIRIAAMTYSYENRIFFGPRLGQGQSNEAIRNQINAMTWTKGGTFTYAALQKAGQEMRDKGRPGIPHIIVTLTDGISADMSKTILEATKLKNAGNHLMSVGIGQQLRHSELDAMADKPTDKFKFIVNDFRLLDMIVAKVKRAMFCAPNNPQV